MLGRPASVVLALTTLLAAGGRSPVARAETVMRVAVLDFTNAASAATGGGAELDSLGKGLQSMVTTDLAQVQSLQLVERARLRDIESELKLSSSAAVDPSTAVKIGKLAGASHLVTGSFTVVGEKMRIDCRLFSVDQGSVLTAASADGEKAAFFELEKTVVQKVIAGAGVKLAPKERAEIGRVHTADFDAFSRFSEGIALFDEKRYADAVAALRDATSRDQDFKLAALTLGQYEELIAKLRAKATEVETAQLDLSLLETQKGARLQADIVERLTAIAKMKKNTVERAVALYVLAVAYGTSNYFDKLYPVEDRFLMERSADAASRSYFDDALGLFPRLPLLIGRHWENWLLGGRGKYRLEDLDSLAHFDEAFAGAVHEMLTLAVDDKGPMYLRREYMWEDAGDPEPFAMRLHLDRRQQAALHARLFDAAQKKLAPPDAWKEEQLDKLGLAHRRSLELDRSTAYFTQAASRSKDVSFIKRMTDEVARNAELQRVIEKGTPRPAVREFLMLSDRRGNLARDAEKLFTSSELSPKAAAALDDLRFMFKPNPYMLLGEEPVYSVNGRLGTGARSDELRTSELRYYVDQARGEPLDALAIVGGTPIKTVAVSFVASFTPAADWWPRDHPPYREKTFAERKFNPARPSVGLLFGVRDLDSNLRDPKTAALLRPTRGWLLEVAAGALRLLAVSEAPRPDEYEAPKHLVYRLVEEKKVRGLDGPEVRLSVEIVDGGVQVRVANGDIERFYMKDDHAGFFGFAFRGPGYASVSQLKVRR